MLLPSGSSVPSSAVQPMHPISIPPPSATPHPRAQPPAGGGGGWEERLIVGGPHNNIPPHIAALVGRDLHLQPNHPLSIIKKKIEQYFVSRDASFVCRDSMDPITTTHACFDTLLIPPDHQSRKPSDTYYIDEKTLLRTHTSAHQTELLSSGETKFLCTGDVYRRDEIDASHYPAFHQMEGVKLIERCKGMAGRDEWVSICIEELKADLEGMVDELFGKVEKRWVDAYFPFTEPSLELEILFEGEWLEVLGCGVMQQKILDSVGLHDQHGWAFGLGLERLAMVLFQIPDIRLFWSKDERFLSQFRAGEITKFEPFSKYPPCYKDIAFWVPEGFEENNFMEMVRGVAGDVAESVVLLDRFENKKIGKTSHCYRINYRAMDRNLTNEEVDAMQARLRDEVPGALNVELGD
eukprot:CAMPEP_0173389046 /NCGR_PEP_ID=MMETSP1356-20130122/11208_1 /TAXON_ID=77927 ORGANISM="Hemiselmis virescens, Strain PCC157" /NCGR_SAMPLE_ID=MMETSP1356 /ASSEMBLY_ACC=CAM_ASM_000847 /LENGTH=407 /DNA_ID=CAMNT_0014346097 /DNA_START=9 /DNA_END=1231 /DNA_ORIENTATION=+